MLDKKDCHLVNVPIYPRGDKSEGPVRALMFLYTNIRKKGIYYPCYLQTGTVMQTQSRVLRG